MVIGHGLIAKAFCHYKNRKDVLIFASGVSNSGETNNEQFLREQKNLIQALQHHGDKLFVYFSTCSIEDKDISKSSYVLHKVRIEQLISSTHENYLIFRLPQVVGKSVNRTTLVNYFFDKIINGTTFTLWKNAVRYIIDVDDVAKIVSYIIDNQSFRNRIIKVAALRYSVLDIVQFLEKLFDKKANYTLIEKGKPFEIDISETEFVIKELNIKFNGDYLENVLRKYYCDQTQH